MDRNCPLYPTCPKIMGGRISTIMHLVDEHLDDPKILVYLKNVRDGT